MFVKPHHCVLLTLCLLSLSFAGCSTQPFVPPANSHITESQLIAAPFYPQQQYQCGPAALATVLNFQDAQVSVETLIQQVYIPNKKGSLQLEIKAAIRRANLLPYELPGNLNALLTQVSDGQPVLVLQNLGLSLWPQWHYAVVVGFDLKQQTLTLHSGTHKNYSLAIGTFMNTWERSNFWAVMAVQATASPKHLDESRYINAATSLEEIGKPSIANQAYQSALKQWPENHTANLGMGNASYQQGDFAAATDYYLQSLQTKPADAASWNNLAFALAQQQCPALATQAVNKALSLNGNKSYQASKNELNAILKTGATNGQGLNCKAIKLPL